MIEEKSNGSAPNATDERRLEILKERARELAQIPEIELDEERIEVVQFDLAGEQYGIDTEYVREVCPVTHLAQVPCAPGFVVGIMSLRGEILSVVDLRRFFGLPERGISDSSKIVVVYSDDVEFGILADRIDVVASVPTRTLQESLATLAGARERFLRGVTPDRVAVLDIETILSDERLRVDEEP